MVRALFLDVEGFDALSIRDPVLASPLEIREKRQDDSGTGMRIDPCANHPWTHRRRLSFSYG